jgi:phenylpyruvate tautomerase PptA (4-oxalocrotonate tautomerase family)
MRNLKPHDLDELIEALTDLEVDVATSDGEVVKVFVE